MDTFLTMFLPIAICISGLIYFYRRRRFEDEECENPYYGITDKKELFTTALRRMGFEYIVDKEHNGNVDFKFQGENLRAVDLAEEHNLIQILDLWWYTEDLNDIDNVALLQKAVNICNTHIYGTVMYSYSDDNGKIGIHSRIDLALTPEINDVETYLRFELDGLMRLHILFFQVLQSLKDKEDN